MKNLLSILCMYLFATSALAQNTFPSSGNTGIGTTSPSKTLQVVGQIAAGSNGYGMIQIGRDDGTNTYVEGTTDPQGYKLAVAGNMIAESVKVKLQGNWPDFIFSDTHKHLSLGELEKFIKVNKHLPEIPVAEEVKKEGIDVGQMNIKLLQKIEELTMYAISHHKQLETLEQTLKNQQNEITLLKTTKKP